MAVCKTIRTNQGIKEFLIQSENGDEHVTAFRYLDETVEVHSLRTDCPPLYLDEKTSLCMLSDDQFGHMLIAVYPKRDTNHLEMRVWDVMVSTQGFVQKDVMCKSDSRKECKHRYHYSLQSIFEENIHTVFIESYGNLLCLLLNGKLCMLLKFKSLDVNALCFEVKSTYTNPSNDLLISQAMFLKSQDNIYLALLENTVIRILQVQNDNLNSLTMLMAPSKPTLQPKKISKLYKVTSSKCLVIDSSGQMFLLVTPNELLCLKFPSSLYGHGICSAVGFKHTNEGILAICNNDYTVNFYLLADILCSVINETLSFVKPYRVFCCQFPINAISFIKSDQLAMVSAVNQSITFLGGLVKAQK